MRNYYHRDLLLAAKVAVRSWNGNEAALCLKIQKNRCIDQNLGQEWLNYWMLARTAPLKNRTNLYQYMTMAHMQLLSKNLTSPRAYRLVQSIANSGAKLRATTGRPLSLVSKLAFSCQPELFTPYDQRARAALKLVGHTVNGDYCAFMDAFNRELRPFRAELTKSGINRQSGIFNFRVTMSRNLFELRTFDKYLMLQGGFSRRKMEEIASGVKQKRHAGAFRLTKSKKSRPYPAKSGGIYSK